MVDMRPKLSHKNIKPSTLNSILKDIAEHLEISRAAKSAVDGIAKVMALELGVHGITVNVVGPGLTLTDAISRQPEEMLKRSSDANPLRRIGKPEDIAGAVVFLSSPLSDYVTGEYIPVNGGSFMI